jgi:hypothetical protein
VFVDLADDPIAGRNAGHGVSPAPTSRSPPIATLHDEKEDDMIETKNNTTITRRYRSPLVRLAAGSLLAGGLLLGGITGVASADTPQSGAAGAQLALTDTPASGASISMGEPSNCRDVFTEAFQEGYRVGFDVGYWKGYDKGFQAGYGAGYEPKLKPYMLNKQGLKPGPCQNDYEQGFAAGYGKGEKKGFQVGYQDGWRDGFLKAKQDSAHNPNHHRPHAR